MRIECGNGQIAVHDGTLDGVPCLSIGNNGTGVIGGKVEGGEMPEEIEILNVTFLNKESVEVWIKHLTLVKDMIINADNYERKAILKVSILYKNWWVHNLIAHPLMQLVGVFSLTLASLIHDATLPERLSNE